MKKPTEFGAESFAENVRMVVASAAANGEVLDVGHEARWISRRHGVSALMTAREIFKEGIRARVAMDVPLAKDLPAAVRQVN